MQLAIKGQSFWQSGIAGFSVGQHGISSGMEAISDIAAMEAPSIIVALDGMAIGATRRPTTARAASRRAMNDRICTAAECHMLGPQRRRIPSRFG